MGKPISASLYEAPLNWEEPRIMHIDLNSCFAIIEQQANPLIRNKPVVVAPYNKPTDIVIAPSYEAKALDIRLGTHVHEARQLGAVVLMPDPAKYRVARERFEKILLDYTSEIIPKSVDEFIINWHGSPVLRAGRDLKEVGLEIKQRIKEDLGEYVTVNVGLGPNRFLAKTAAGLHKPDGLDVISATNLRSTLKELKLTDLPGINVRYEARLNINGIFSPLQFLDAGPEFLIKRVFKSKVGGDWYLRLRGWEVDDVDWGRKSFGHQYAIVGKTDSREYLSKLLMKLCEKTGRRLRAGGYSAHGVHLWLAYQNKQHWHQGRKTRSRLYATQEIYLAAQRLLNQAPLPAPASHIGVSVFNLELLATEQLGLFDEEQATKRALADAADKVNDRYGEFTLVPALMANMENIILDRIAFGK